MGIQDRDYYRDESNGFFNAWGRQGAGVWIVILTCACFFAQCVNSNPVRSPLTALAAYDPVQIADGEVWRLVTPLFLHVSFWHLFCNMLTVYWAASRVEELYGSREFLAFYLLGGTFSHTIYFVLYLLGATGPTLGLGASGAVMAVLVLLVFHYPNLEIRLFGVLPVPLWALVLLYAGSDLLGALRVLNAPIGYVVHLGGALFGLLYYQTGARFTWHSQGRARPKHAAPARTAPTRPALRVVPAPDESTPNPVPAEPLPPPREVPDEQLEARVDQVLQKVSQHGQDSLTLEERELLVRASEQYKKRRK